MTALPLRLPSLPSRGGCANGADGVVLRATPPSKERHRTTHHSSLLQTCHTPEQLLVLVRNLFPGVVRLSSRPGPLAVFGGE